MNVFEKGLVTVLACCAVFIATSVPLIFRKVPRNPVYGYRTRRTLSDDSIWYDANAYFGTRFSAASLIAACLAAALYEWGNLAPRTYLNATVALLVAPVLAAGLLTARFVRGLESERRSPGDNR